MTKGPAWETDKGTFLRVVVSPASRGTDFVSEINTLAVHINLKSPAKKGKANTELVKKLAKKLGVSTTDIALVAGHRSREKTLLITRFSPEQILSRLSSIV